MTSRTNRGSRCSLLVAGVFVLGWSSMLVAAPQIVAGQAESTDDADDTDGKTLEDFDPQQRAMIESILRSTEHVTDPQALQKMVTNVSRGLQYMPPKQKEAMEFAIKKVEERIKELGS